MRLRVLLGADDDTRGAVVDAGRVARRRRALGVEHRLQRRELLERRVAADALVALELPGRDDLLGEPAGVLRRGRAGVRPCRPRVLGLAGDAELARDARRLHDHVVAVERRREPVEDHVVEELAVAELVAEARLRDQVGSVRHRLHPARDDDVVEAGADHQVGDLDRADRRRAHLVDRVGGHLLRDPRADRRLPGGRLAGACLQHLAHDDVADLGRVDPGPLEPGRDRDRAELRGGNAGEPAAELPERRADGGDDDGAGHARQGSRGAARGFSLSPGCRPTEGTSRRRASERAYASTSRDAASTSESCTISAAVCM